MASPVGALGSVPCVYAGVLLKYVNMAKGWRDRLFVLANNKLVYYKLSGKRAVNVQSVLDQIDPSGDNIRLIGAKIYLLLKEKRNGVPPPAVDEPAASYDLHLATLRESHTESTKFYVHCPGSSACTVRTETPDDRLAWVSALAGQKLQISGQGPKYQDQSTTLAKRFGVASNGQAGPPLTSAAKLVEDLKKKDAMGDPSCQRILVALRKQLRDAEAEMQEKNDQIQHLMDERRQLQTELVTETQRLEQLPDELASGRETSSSQNDEEDDDDNISIAGSSRFITHTHQRQISERDGDFFYDAPEALPRKQPNPSTGSSHTTSTPEHTSPDWAEHSALPTSSLETAAPAVSSASPEQFAVTSSEAGPPSAAGTLLLPTWVGSEPSVERRLALPDPKETQKSVGLWSIIKEAIGKDLTRICLPVYFNEPLSALQKMVEELEYAYLLDKSTSCPKGSMSRLAWLAIFAISGYAASDGRTCKPFNPLLGETYEMVDKERKFRFLAEKVVHHPTVLAAHCEGSGWTLDGDLEVKSKFWGRCIELKPFGRLEVKYHDGEVLSWNKVTTTINNLILGKIYVDHAGIMRVSSNIHSNEMRVKFKDTGSVFGASKRTVTGSSFEGGHERPGFRIEGVWCEYLRMDTGNGMETVWKAADPPKDPTRYNLTQFAIQLNELTPGLEEKLPPTDCRLRPDQSCLEQGYFDKANEEKQRLEKKQRRARKEAEEGVPIVSRWFEPVQGAARGKMLSYRYKGGYWEERENGQFTECRDIFGQED